MMQLIFTGTVVVVPLSGRFFPVLFGDGRKTEKAIWERDYTVMAGCLVIPYSGLF